MAHEPVELGEAGYYNSGLKRLDTKIMGVISRHARAAGLGSEIAVQGELALVFDTPENLESIIPVHISQLQADTKRFGVQYDDAFDNLKNQPVRLYFLGSRICGYEPLKQADQSKVN